jgi:hypothetical protein
MCCCVQRWRTQKKQTKKKTLAGWAFSLPIAYQFLTTNQKIPYESMAYLPFASKCVKLEKMSRKVIDRRQKMVRRGCNKFKLTDVVRAIRSAEAGGLAIGGVEVVTKDGTTIRVLSKGAEHAANPWDSVLTHAADKERPS